MTLSDFEEYVSARSPALLRTAFLLCGGDRGAAEDMLQDVLERVYPKWHRIKDHPEAYIRAALANAAANRWRFRSRRVVEVPLHDASPPAVPGPEQAVANQDLVVRALGTLPARMRAVLVLRFYDDLSEVDTAAALRCGVGTVKSQTSRGLSRLRTLLAPHALAPTTDRSC
ncbi:MAG TPA: SigE family RNA polymerase sigma factor [Actinophytocola sp.]|uniref:SigE family RNA polymerase sigma factor n=1 Tax=Actinophytocola sp. TaxID=1872138 RepID=UPI002DB97FF6|nr:SigE family RNA polymerase sigma factor [Actinophytocola sp.]HEU5470029.1 SigE family RNA polymerase sigma factor [Actinophytocola sp.]